ncbi:hypothetical protein HDU93_009542 [Gonapodya sp. JEL0774]|nr:hypothetical protein HDU93_009542 [Gonapodya sp. JEL0774]
MSIPKFSFQPPSPQPLVQEFADPTVAGAAVPSPSAPSSSPYPSSSRPTTRCISDWSHNGECLQSGSAISLTINGVPSSAVDNSCSCLEPSTPSKNTTDAQDLTEVLHALACAYILYYGENHILFERANPSLSPAAIKWLVQESWKTAGDDIRVTYLARSSALALDIKGEQERILTALTAVSPSMAEPHPVPAPISLQQLDPSNSGFPVLRSLSAPDLPSLEVYPTPSLSPSPSVFDDDHFCFSDGLLSSQNWLDLDSMLPMEELSVPGNLLDKSGPNDLSTESLHISLVNVCGPQQQQPRQEPSKTFWRNSDRPSTLSVPSSRSHKRSRSADAVGGTEMTESSSDIAQLSKKPCPSRRRRYPNGPKHPRSAFLHYLNSVIAQYNESCRGIRIGAKARLISERWSALSAEEKEPFVQLAEMDKARYRKEKEAWKPVNE